VASAEVSGCMQFPQSHFSSVYSETHSYTTCIQVSGFDFAKIHPVVPLWFLINTRIFFFVHHNTVFIADLKLLHVSALFTDHHGAVHYIKTNMYNANITTCEFTNLH
jgi:hypothetical protein